MGPWDACSPVLDGRLLPRARHGLASLTPREREVLRIVVSGLSAKEAAETLGISTRTAELHLSRVRDKMGLRNVVLLALYVAVIEGVALG